MTTRNARNDPTAAPEPSAFDNSADPPRNFSLNVNERVRALTIGAPAFAARKKRLEDFEEATIRLLVVLHDKLHAQGHSRAAIEDALLDRAQAVDLRPMNDVLDAHNRYYPIEANLPTDPRTGEYLLYGRRWEPDPPWTAERLVELTLEVLAQRET
ncbi:MAG: hypothetical protein JWP97_5306 [Labilithrix sp.]|nr:hypothetical protein [Labilithrix sp.]